jgi:hypothetical protein
MKLKFFVASLKHFKSKRNHKSLVLLAGIWVLLLVTVNSLKYPDLEYPADDENDMRRWELDDLYVRDGISQNDTGWPRQTPEEKKKATKLWTYIGKLKQMWKRQEEGKDYLPEESPPYSGIYFCKNWSTASFLHTRDAYEIDEGEMYVTNATRNVKSIGEPTMPIEDVNITWKTWGQFFGQAFYSEFEGPVKENFKVLNSSVFYKEGYLPDFNPIPFRFFTVLNQIDLDKKQYMDSIREIKEDGGMENKY